MKDFLVSYYLGDMYHAYTVRAEKRTAAKESVLNRLPEGSKAIMHDLKIKEA